jgi:hypothetical protein
MNRQAAYFCTNMLRKLLKKPLSGVLLAVLFLIAYLLIQNQFSFNASIVFAVFVFQLLLIYALISEIRLYRKSRKGPFVIGELLEVRKVADKDDPDLFSYLGTVEFSWPDENNKYKVEYTDKDKIPEGKLFTISVNRTDPSQSIVRNQFHILWWLGQITGWLIVIGLSYVNYLHMMKPQLFE